MNDVMKGDAVLTISLRAIHPNDYMRDQMLNEAKGLMK